MTDPKVFAALEQARLDLAEKQAARRWAEAESLLSLARTALDGGWPATALAYARDGLWMLDGLPCENVGHRMLVEALAEVKRKAVKWNG